LAITSFTFNELNMNAKSILLIAPWHNNEHDSQEMPLHLRKKRMKPPLGLLSIGGSLINEGFDIDFIDTRIESDYKAFIKETLLSKEYLFICMNVSLEVSQSIPKAKEIQEYCKTIKPKLKFVWGGLLASAIPDYIMNSCKPDILVRNEGEITIKKIAQSLTNSADIGSIDNIYYLKDGEVIRNSTRKSILNSDDYPIPAWSLIKNNLNKNQVPYYLSINTSFGCQNNCSFCYYRNYDDISSPRKWRGRTTDSVIDELQQLYELSGSNVFTFDDDNFIGNKERTIQIFNKMKLFEFYAERVRLSTTFMDDDIIDAMSGTVNCVAFSVETASKRFIPILGKQIDLEKTIQFTEKLFRKGINSTLGFMFGLPDENDEDRKLNVEFMQNIKAKNPLARPSNAIFKPIPNTPILNHIDKTYTETKFLNPGYFDNFDWSMNTDFAYDTNDYFINKEEQKFIVIYSYIFETLFNVANYNKKESIKGLIASNERFKYIFGDVDNYYWLKNNSNTYLLDRVLNNEEIDLTSDLQNYKP
jgi:radical SAM superfamily enzyme YgiQ (UPF0313 family)